MDDKIYVRPEECATRGFGRLSIENTADLYGKGGDEIFDEFWDEVVADKNSDMTNAVDEFSTKLNAAFNEWLDERREGNDEESS